jgi:hypothetical protein
MVYIDRGYTYSTVPTWLQGATYIKTANGDKNSSAVSFLTFDVNQDVTVYVAYDSRVTTKPSWLESFTDTGDDLVNTDTTFDLFAKSYPAGTITLGGNYSGATSMYTVIIVGQGNGNSASEVIIDFGVKGTWTYMNNSTLVQMHHLSPEIITAADMDGNGQDDVIIDFGAQYGIWVRMNNNSTLVQMHHLSPEIITAADMDGNGQDDVVIDFGPQYGIFVRMNNNSTLVQMHYLSPEIITAADMDGNGQDDVVIDFGPQYGIFVRMNNNSTLVQMHYLSSEIITAADMDGN